MIASSSDCLPSRHELEQLFVRKYGQPESTGWAPKRRFKFHYFTPADFYEACVSKCVTPGCTWLDVGGGHAVFPNNPDLARDLVARCTKVVAVDPSENVRKNTFVQEAIQSTLEDYTPDRQFDLATMRMVVEHVSDPEAFLTSLSRLIRPGGRAVVFTVDLWSPITILSRLVPFQMHHAIKRFFWKSEEEDTFPVQYRMNTRPALRRLFERAGFAEEMFLKVDDLALFGEFRSMNHAELLAWRSLRAIGLRYPEKCLLATYRRQ